MLPYLVRADIADVVKIKKIKKPTKAKKIPKSLKPKKTKILNGKRKTKPKEAVGLSNNTNTGGKKLLTNNFSELKKLLPGIGLMVADPDLQSFSETPAWKNFIRKMAPVIMTAFLTDTKIIKRGEMKQCLGYAKNQSKPPTT